MAWNKTSTEWFDKASRCCGDHDALPPNLPPPISFMLSLSLSFSLFVSWFRLLSYPWGKWAGRTWRGAGGLPERERHQPGQEGVPAVALSLPLFPSLLTSSFCLSHPCIQYKDNIPHTHTNTHNRIQSAIIGSLRTQMHHTANLSQSATVQSICSFVRHLVQSWPREEGWYTHQPLMTVPYSRGQRAWGGNGDGEMRMSWGVCR